MSGEAANNRYSADFLCGHTHVRFGPEPELAAVHCPGILPDVSSPKWILDDRSSRATLLRNRGT